MNNSIHAGTALKSLRSMQSRADVRLNESNILSYFSSTCGKFYPCKWYNYGCSVSIELVVRRKEG